MVAVDVGLRDNGGMDLSVRADHLARELIDTADPDWLRELIDALDREVRTSPLERLITHWKLSNAAAARLFGVSRQAFAKWLDNGPPAERADDVTTVDNITGLLDRYLKRERIAAVVRRPSENLGSRSILEALEDGDYQEAERSIRSTFDLRRVQP